VGSLAPHLDESVTDAAIRIAQDYDIPAGMAPELARVLEDAKAQKHAVEERRHALERLSELEESIRGFFRSMRSAASFLKAPELSDQDRELIANEFLRASLYEGAPELIALGCPESHLEAQHFRHFVSAIVDFASTSESIERIMLEHDKRTYRDVAVWNLCLDEVFYFWTVTLDRRIKNSFEKPDGPHREQGEPTSEGARFLAECMMVIDAPAYRAERLMRLLDVYRKDDLGRP